MATDKVFKAGQRWCNSLGSLVEIVSVQNILVPSPSGGGNVPVLTYRFLGDYGETNEIYVRHQDVTGGWEPQEAPSPDA